MKFLSRLLILFLLFTVSNSLAKNLSSKQYLELARKSYLYSLNSNNYGVRNSIIFLVVQFKNLHPNENFKPFIKKFKKMSKDDPQIQNRLHAYLALVCLENPKSIASINPNDYENPKIFFNAVYNLLTDIQLAMK